MWHADNPLLHEIVRSAHDPDPVHAARFRPFGYPTVRRPLDAPPFGRSGRRTLIASLVAKLVAPATVLAPGRRAAPAPCC
jgi:hypothetical protein